MAKRGKKDDKQEYTAPVVASVPLAPEEAAKPAAEVLADIAADAAPLASVEPDDAPGLPTWKVIELTGVSGPTLSTWKKSGAITPSIADPGVQGQECRWSDEDVDRIVWLRAALGNVAGLARFESVAEALKHYERTGDEQVVVITTKGIRVVSKRDALTRLAAITAEPCIVFPRR
jgi:hypothetical protein